MTDLYDELGVEKTADTAAIRRAYRKAAKRAHPDGGGSIERFALVTLAHDTLTDGKRRERYDRTGETGDGKAGDLGNQALQAALQAVEAVIGEAKRRNVNPEEFDLVGDAIKTLNKQVEMNRAAKSDAVKSAKGMAKIVKRLRSKRGKPNLIGPMLERRQKDFESQADDIDAGTKVLEAAVEILRGHTFDVEQRAPYPFNDTAWGQLAGLRS